jgi:hypothetical protein
MNNSKSRRHLVFVIPALLALAQGAEGDTVVAVSASQVGGFHSDGTYANSFDFQNYYVGYSTLTSRAERRSFFVFDMPIFTPPPGPLVGIELSLWLPAGGLVFGTQLNDDAPPVPVPDTAETFAVSLSPAPAGVVTSPVLDVATAMAVFGTLGTGGLGSKTITAGEPLGFVPPPPGYYPFDIAEIVVPFSPAGIGLFLASVVPGSTIVLGGHMASWTSNDEVYPTPYPPDPGKAGDLVEKSEIMFGLSDYRAFIPPLGGPDYTGLPAPTLRFVFADAVVPIPGAVWLLSGALGTLACLRRRKRLTRAYSH